MANTYVGFARGQLWSSRAFVLLSTSPRLKQYSQSVLRRGSFFTTPYISLLHKLLLMAWNHCFLSRQLPWGKRSPRGKTGGALRDASTATTQLTVLQRTTDAEAAGSLPPHKSQAACVWIFCSSSPAWRRCKNSNADQHQLATPSTRQAL